MTRADGVSTWLQGPAAGACVVSGAGCKHTHSGGGRDKQQELAPTAGSLAAVGALVPAYNTVAAGSHHGAQQGRLVMGVMLEECRHS